MSNYDIDKFKQQYLNVNFDQILIEQSNNVVNSNKYYLRYKNDYLKSTKDNFNILSELIPKFNDLNNVYTKTDSNKYTYRYIKINDKNEYDRQIREIYTKQKMLLNDFIHYIDYLNKIKDSIKNEL